MAGNLSLLILILWPLAGALLAFWLGRSNKRHRDYFSMLVAFLELALALFVLVKAGNQPVFFRWETFGGLGLALKSDGLRGIYCVITSFMWLTTLVFSREYFHHYRNRNRYHFFTLLTLSFTIGVFLAADLTTTFLFFEMMSFTSLVMVINNEKPPAIAAAKLYIFVALGCGLVMLLGIQMLSNLMGTLNFDELFTLASAMTDKSSLFLPGILLLAGFGAKAGMFPLHIWLPEAHPVAPAPASALLSGVLTKTGVLGILAVTTNLFYHDGNWGFLILVLGTITMVLGAVLGLFTMDLKRILACSSVSQIGFILVGTGMQGLLGHHNALAVRGTFLHMVNHSLIKLALFLVAGAININIHELNLNKIRGFGRGKPILHFTFLMGALSIMGIPLSSGYISKTLLHESIVEYIHLLEGMGQSTLFYQGVEWLFLLTGGFTIAYILKIYFALFWETNEVHQEEFDAFDRHYLRRKSNAALLASALVLPVLGLFPYHTMNPLADLAQSFMHGHSPDHAVHYFAWINLQGAVYSIFIGLLVYCFFVRKVLMGRQPAAGADGAAAGTAAGAGGEAGTHNSKGPRRKKGKSKDKEKEKAGGGQRGYLNRWPQWLDLNGGLYQPLFTKVLPGLGFLLAKGIYIAAEKGFDIMLAAAISAGIILAGKVHHLAALSFGGGLALFLTAGLTAGRLIYGITQRGIDDVITQGDQLIRRLFSAVDKVAAAYHEAVSRKVDRHQDFTFSSIPKERKEEYDTWRGINSSLSYSLLLFGIGLLAAMIFLLSRW